MAEKITSTVATFRNNRRKTRRMYSAEEKIRIVIKGLRGENTVAEIYRREVINQNLQPHLYRCVSQLNPSMKSIELNATYFYDLFFFELEINLTSDFIQPFRCCEIKCFNPSLNIINIQPNFIHRKFHQLIRELCQEKCVN